MKSLIAFLVLLISFSGLAQEDILNTIDNHVEKAQSSFAEENWESAKTHSENALVEARKLENDTLLFSLLIEFGNQSTKMLDFDLALQYLWEAEQIKNKSDLQRAAHHSALGNLYEKMEVLRSAIDQKVAAYELKTDFYLAGSIANLYLKIGEMDSMLLYFRHQLHIGTTAKDLRKKVYACNNLGYGFSEIPMNDSALFYYSMAIELLEEITVKTDDDLFNEGMIHGNVGMVLYAKKEYDRAIPHLELDFKTSQQFDYPDLVIHVGEGLYDAYDKAGKTSRLPELLEHLSTFRNRLSKERLLTLMTLELRYYKDKESASSFEKRVSEYLRVQKEYTESIQQKANETTKILADYRLRQIKTELELQRVISNESKSALSISQQKEKNARLTIGLVISVFSTLLVAAWLYYRFRRRQAQTKSLLLEAEKSKLNTELKLRKLELTDFAINLNRNKEFSNDIAKHISVLKKASHDEIPEKLSALSALVNQHLNIGATLEVFHQNVDSVNKEFFERLSELHPQLTNHDKEMCGLIRLHLSNKEIANIKNISDQSARTARYRLKKKLQPDSDEDLADYLSSI